jgi:hypothetical protein
MKMFLTVISLSICLAACSRSETQNVPDSSSTNTSSEWTQEIRKSPVYGNQFIALYRNEGKEGITTAIKITCIEKSKLLSVELGLSSEDKDAGFSYDISKSVFGTPVEKLHGAAVTALNARPIPASDIFVASDFKNVANFRASAGDEIPDAFVKRLPIAAEIGSNYGTITYQIPKSDLVLATAAKCVRSQDEKDQDQAEKSARIAEYQQQEQVRNMLRTRHEYDINKFGNKGREEPLAISDWSNSWDRDNPRPSEQTSEFAEWSARKAQAKSLWVEQWETDWEARWETKRPPLPSVQPSAN